MSGRFLLLAAVHAIWITQAAPTLPRLPIETYPTPMRQAIEPVYREALAHPADAARAGLLARLLHAWEQWDSAHEAYVQAVALAHDAFDWRYLDGCVLQRLARPADAATRLKEALAIRPDYLPARVKLADALFDAGRIEESRIAFTALTREPLAEPEALFGLGRIAAAEGKYSAAVEDYERALALFPEWGSANYSLAIALRALGRRDEARQALERHRQYGARWPGIDDPVLGSIASARADPAARMRRAQKLADDGQTADAIAEYEEVLAADGTSALAHEALVKLYGRVRDWPKTEEHFKAALALGGDAAGLQYDHGVFLGIQEKWEAAADAYRQAIAINPSYPEAHNNLGQILERDRQFDAALEEYRRALEGRPAFRVARYNAGRMLIALGKPVEAVSVLEGLVEPRDAESARYVFALSVASMQSGNRDAAIKWGTEARARAAETGQAELAAAIDRQLAAIR